MQLFDEYIHVRPHKPEERTKSGIYVAEKSKTYPPTGDVLAVGDKVDRVKEGDTIVFLRFAAIQGHEDDTRFVKQKHVIGVIDDATSD